MNSPEIGADGKKWPQTMDAMVWAKEFVGAVEKAPFIATDEGVMLGWFANAIMAGYDEAQRRFENQACQPTSRA